LSQRWPLNTGLTVYVVNFTMTTYIGYRYPVSQTALLSLHSFPNPAALQDFEIVITLIDTDEWQLNNTSLWLCTFLQHTSGVWGIVITLQLLLSLSLVYIWIFFCEISGWIRTKLCKNVHWYGLLQSLCFLESEIQYRNKMPSLCLVQFLWFFLCFV